MAKCIVKSCEKESTWRLTWEMRVHANHSPATMDMLEGACDDHIQEVFDWFNGPEMFEELSKFFPSAGFMKPVRKFSRLIKTRVG